MAGIGDMTVRVIADTGAIARALDDIVRRLERIEMAQRPWWRRLLDRLPDGGGMRGMSGGNR